MVDGTDSLEEIQPPPPGHLLIEQHHPVRLPLKEDQSIVAVRSGLDGEALLLQKQDMRREAFDLIIYPQNAFRPGHAPNLTGVSGER
jgi:hypothetical protein